MSVSGQSISQNFHGRLKGFQWIFHWIAMVFQWEFQVIFICVSLVFKKKFQGCS